MKKGKMALVLWTIGAMIFGALIVCSIMLTRYFLKENAINGNKEKLEKILDEQLSDDDDILADYAIERIGDTFKVIIVRIYDDEIEAHVANIDAVTLMMDADYADCDLYYNEMIVRRITRKLLSIN